MDQVGPDFFAGASFARYQYGAFNLRGSLSVQRDPTHGRIISQDPLILREKAQSVVIRRTRRRQIGDLLFSTRHE
jgi:hypothetical protein